MLSNSNYYARRYAKNAVRIKQAFENGSYSTDAKQCRKTRFDDVNIALLAWFKKTGMKIPEVVINGQVLLEEASRFAKGISSISAAWID
jgi:hypothetical protein